MNGTTNAATDATDATLTEYLSATDNTDPSTDGAAKLIHTQDGAGNWTVGDGEELDSDPDEYRAECSCGEEFAIWGAATEHVDEEH